MFNQMISDIDQDILKKIFRTNIANIGNSQRQSTPVPKNIKMKHIMKLYQLLIGFY